MGITSYAKYIEFDIVAVTHENSDGTSRSEILEVCHPGHKLQLIPDPENKFDNNAIKVCLSNTKIEQIGYLSRPFARKVTSLLANNSLDVNLVLLKNINKAVKKNGDDEKIIGATGEMFKFAKLASKTSRVSK